MPGPLLVFCPHTPLATWLAWVTVVGKMEGRLWSTSALGQECSRCAWINVTSVFTTRSFSHLAGLGHCCWCFSHALPEMEGSF